jgi:hydroxyethylthiazole kinase
MPASPSLPNRAATAWSAATAAELLRHIRERRPRVHCLTNPVAMTFSANLLLAAGAVPSMTPDPEAQGDFVATSAALVVNLGMLEPSRAAAARAAIAVAGRLGRPWLLDPVKVERSPARLAFARELIAEGAAAVRGNGTEIEVLTSGHALPHGVTLAATGPVDLVTDGVRAVRLANGSPLMDRVTAMGCAASALAGAFLAVEQDSFAALASAILVMGVAGELAAETASGPGSFVPAFLDAVYTLDADTLAQRARIA